MLEVRVAGIGVFNKMSDVWSIFPYFNPLIASQFQVPGKTQDKMYWLRNMPVREFP